MITDSTVDLDQLDSALAAAAPQPTPREQQLAVALYRLLAAGQPVSVATAAQAIGADLDEAEGILRSWPAVFRDEAGAVIGFGGLALAEMPPHRLRIGERELFAWCAWDPFFLALIVGPMDVETVDANSGEKIAYHLDVRGTMSGLTHPDAVLSFLRPDRPWDDNVMATFCHYVLHFTDTRSARTWIEAHPGTFIITQADAAELAARHVERTFGAGMRAAR